MLNTASRQQGITLIELMVASAAGAVVSLLIISTYITTVKSVNSQLSASRLNQDLNAIMQFIQKDVSRAGYWAADPVVEDLKSNPFFNAINDLQSANLTGQPSHSCLLYSYDLNKNKKVGVALGGTVAAPFDATPYDLANIEQFGVRLKNQVIERRTGLSSAVDNQFSCDHGSWQAMHQNNIEITKLSFNVSDQCLNISNESTPCATSQAALLRRSIQIELTGRLKNDPSVVYSITGKVMLRNDKFVESY